MSEEQKEQKAEETKEAGAEKVSRLKEFLGKGPAKWFEGGDKDKRPKYFDARPIASVIKQAGDVVYFLKDQEGKADAVLSDGKPANQSLVDTDAHKYFEAMEKRFNEVVPETKILIIDPDVVRGKYAMDPSPKASLVNTVKLYLTERVKDKAPTVAHHIDEDYAKMLVENAFNGEAQHTMALRENVTRDNIAGYGYLDIVVGSNPDMPGLWKHFNKVPGLEKDLDVKGVTPEMVRDFILYHELGHATDKHRKDEGKKSVAITPLENMYNRHHTECVADCHAVIQSIKDNKKSDFVDLWAQFRLYKTCSAIENYMGKLDGSAVPELEKILDKQSDEASSIKETDTEAQIFLKKMFTAQESNSYIRPYEGQIEYHTQPTIMAAKAFAEKALADGSLLKMTDKEIIAKCQEIVDASCLSPEKIAQMVVDVYQGKPNEDVDKAFKAFDEAKSSLSTPREEIDAEYAKIKETDLAKRTKLIDEMVGIPEEETPVAPKTQEQLIEENKARVKAAQEQMAVMLWSDQLVDSLIKHGISNENVVKLIMAEKDRVRENHKNEIACESKLASLNAYLDSPISLIATAQTRKTVSDAIDKEQAPKIEKKGVELAVEFIKVALDTCEKAYDGMEKSSQVNSYEQDMDAQLAHATQTTACYKETVKNEKYLRAMSFEIRKDKEAWEVLGAVPFAKKKMANASLHKHPLWLDQYHANALKGGPMLGVAMRDTLKDIAKISMEIASMPQVYRKIEEVSPELMDRLMQYVPKNVTGAKMAKIAKMPVAEEVESPMQMAARKQRSGR